MIRDQNDPQHYTWHATFRIHSWWKGKIGKKWLIIWRWHDNAGNIERIDFLEEGNETIITHDYLQVFDNYKKGNLTSCSTMPV